jgi:hypothetical protein
LAEVEGSDAKPLRQHLDEEVAERDGLRKFKPGC